MTDLVRKQIWFVKYQAKLLEKFYDGRLCDGEAWRSDLTNKLYAKLGKGIPVSCHELRLARDYIVRKPNGVPSNDRADYEAIGAYWKSLPTLFPADIPIITVWGGDFVSLCDFYHLSISHNGFK